MCVSNCANGFTNLSSCFFLDNFDAVSKKKKKKNAVNLILCTSFFIILFNLKFMSWFNWAKICQHNTSADIAHTSILASIPPASCVALRSRTKFTASRWSTAVRTFGAGSGPKAPAARASPRPLGRLEHTWENKRCKHKSADGDNGQYIWS